VIRYFGPLLLCTYPVISAECIARTWTDVAGKYTIEADLIAFDDSVVVLQRADHELGAVPIDQLSEADRQYLKSKEADEARRSRLGAMQTWTLRDGMKLVGKVVDFTHRDMTIQRRRGRIYVNDRPFENLPEFYRVLIPRIVAHFERINQPDEAGLRAWAIRQRGQPRTFTLDGIILELENGDEYAVPFFLFSDEDRAVLEPGWHEWQTSYEDYEQRDHHAFLLQSLAAARHRDAAIRREIAMMNLKLQAVQAGLTSMWEVTLYPAAGNQGPPRWVVVPGRDSRQATQNALDQNPGFVAGPVRRVSET
jgi:hypothetical protein